MTEEVKKDEKKPAQLITHTIYEGPASERVTTPTRKRHITLAELTLVRIGGPFSSWIPNITFTIQDQKVHTYLTMMFWWRIYLLGIMI